MSRNNYTGLLINPPSLSPLLLCRILDDVIGNLAKNFAEGTEYFKVMHY